MNTCALRRSLLAAMLAVPLLVPSQAPAAESRDTLTRVRDTRTLVLGHRESSRPFSFLGPDRQPAGYSVDLCARIAAGLRERLGLTDLAVKWVQVSPQDRLSRVASGAVDIECGSTTITLSRQEQADFTLMTFVDGGSLLSTDAARIDRVSDLDGKRVAIIAGTTTEAALREAARKVNVTPRYVMVRDHAEGVAALDAGTADAYASDRVLLIGLGRTARDSAKLNVAREYFSYEPYGLVVRRGDPAFRLAVNRELARLYRSGEIVGILRKWFGDMGDPGALLQAMIILQAIPE
jgi:ABC-type amino acid transport substrate-binding protein